MARLSLLFFFLLSWNNASSFIPRVCRDVSVRMAAVNGAQQQQQRANGDLSPTKVETSFVTPPTQVYIEDTDAYGIIYNANYLMFYERALLSHLATNGFDSNSWPIVVSMETMKFKASPSLGDTYVIEGNLKESSSTHQVWDLVMKSSPDDAVVYNVASGFLLAQASSWPALKKPIQALNMTLTPRIDTFQVFRDEFDPDGTLPLRNYMNYFERARSNSLGGPVGLKSLQDQGILVVVTSMKQSHLQESTIKPGCQIQVETEFTVKRRGSVVECKQVASLLEETQVARLAQSTITMMILDAQTMRPTTKLPPELLKKLGQ